MALLSDVAGSVPRDTIPLAAVHRNAFVPLSPTTVDPSAEIPYAAVPNSPGTEPRKLIDAAAAGVARAADIVSTAATRHERTDIATSAFRGQRRG
jgi:hypothetical protein